MSFAFPLYLYGLFLILIPVFIHLFNFRRFRKIYFSNLAFLKQINQQSKKSSQLRHLLILINRILFIIALVLAFSQPYISDNQSIKNNSINKNVVFYIDNSLSMQQNGKNGILLESAKQTSKELASSANETDRFMLVSNDLTSITSGFHSREEFSEDVRNLTFHHASTPFSETINRLARLKMDEKPTDIFIASDFQKSQADFRNFTPDSSINYWFIPFSSPKTINFFIDSCWIDEPTLVQGSTAKINYRISGTRLEEAIDINIRLFVNNKQKGASVVKISSSDVESSFSFVTDSSENQSGYLEIDDHPITFDDKFFFSFKTRKSHKVVLISGNNETDFIEKFYRSDSTVLFSTFLEKQVDYSKLKDANLLIINSLSEISKGLIIESQKFVEAGGNVVFIPSSKNDAVLPELLSQALGIPISNRLDTTQLEIRTIDLKSHLLRDVFERVPENVNWPFFKNRWNYTNSDLSDYQQIINFSDGSPLLLTKRLNAGRIYLFTASLSKSNSNIGRHALFIPLFYNFMLNKSASEKLFYLLDDEMVVVQESMFSSGKNISIINNDRSVDFIPFVRRVNGLIQLFPENRINNSGNYFLTDENQKYPVSYNFNSKESQMSFYENEEIWSTIEQQKWENVKIIDASEISINTGIGYQENHIELWKIFVLLALIFMVIEVILLRFLIK